MRSGCAITLVQSLAAWPENPVPAIIVSWS
jgi:hypothetical protein